MDGVQPARTIQLRHLTDATSANELPNLTATSSPLGKARILAGQERFGTQGFPCACPQPLSLLYRNTEFTLQMKDNVS